MRISVFAAAVVFGATILAATVADGKKGDRLTSAPLDAADILIDFLSDKRWGTGSYWVEPSIGGRNYDLQPPGPSWPQGPRQGWLQSWLTGRGSLFFPDGKYDGEFLRGVPHGQGTWTDNTKHLKYVGEFVEGQAHGQGTAYSIPDGSIIASGKWQNGTFIGRRAEAPPFKPGTTTSAPSGAVEVGLVSDLGTFKVPVEINGAITLHFTLDSGAADVSIPADVVMTLIRTGTIKESDFLGEREYVLADGSIVKSRILRIRSLKVGDRVIENVVGSEADVRGGLLLGQSFLKNFSSWSIDNSRKVLVLN